jgi:hypothetical protein
VHSIQWAGKFVAECFKATFLKWDLAKSIATAFFVIVGGYFSVKQTFRIEFTIYFPDGTKMIDTGIFQLWPLVLGSVLALVAIWVVSSTWAKFHWIEAGGIKAKGTECLLSVSNKGFANQSLDIRLVHIATAEGLDSEAENEMPVTLLKPGGIAGELVLSKGYTEKIHVCDISGTPPKGENPGSIRSSNGSGIRIS